MDSGALLCRARDSWGTRAWVVLLTAVVLLCATTTAAHAESIPKGALRGPLGSAPSRGLAPDAHVDAATLGVGGNITDATEIAFPFGNRTLSVSGSLAYTPGYAEEDVYALYLYAGEVLDLALNGDTGTDFGLAVYGPQATDIYADTPIAAEPPYFYGGSAAYPMSLAFTVPESGYYFINPYTWYDSNTDSNGGTGAYTLDVTLTRSATWMSVGPQATLPYGTPAVIYGQVDSRIYGQYPAGDVLLSASFDGSTYFPLMLTSTTNGVFSFLSVMSGNANVHYQVQYQGTSAYGQSAQRTVSTRYAGLSGASASRAGKRIYNLYGFTQPKHAAGSQPVRVYLWRKVGSKWKAAGSVLTACSDYSDYSRWTVRKKFPSAGKWRMRPLHADADHVATWGPYTYVTVK
jgi:hypothetical protein